MTDADQLRLEIQATIEAAAEVQRLALEYQTAVNDLQHKVMILDLRSESMYSRSAARMVALIGKELVVDAEITGQVKTEMQNWLPHV